MLSWVLACRPRTLIVGVVPVLLSYVWAKRYDLLAHPEFLAFSLGLVICLQVSVNLFNDAIDAEKGADENRIGDKRMASSGAISSSKLKKVATVVLFIGSLCGLPFISLHPAYLLLGIVAIYMCYGYTGGPYPLAYNALGEVFVFLFFGLVATLGPFYALTETIPFQMIRLACILGLGSVMVIAMNNLRDVQTDRLVGKNTLAVKMGDRKFRWPTMGLLVLLIGIRFTFYFNHGQIVFSLVPLVLTLIFIWKLVHVDNEIQKVKLFKFSLLHFLVDSVFLGGLALAT
jgi:1,4-dihydroxy-2-naphthoate octaprenyltransferase